jgi:hypothetical protein
MELSDGLAWRIWRMSSEGDCLEMQQHMIYDTKMVWKNSKLGVMQAT